MVSKHESLQEKLTKNGNLVYSMSCCYKPRLILGSSVETQKEIVKAYSLFFLPISMNGERSTQALTRPAKIPSNIIKVVHTTIFKVI